MRLFFFILYSFSLMAQSDFNGESYDSHPNRIRVGDLIVNELEPLPGKSLKKTIHRSINDEYYVLSEVLQGYYKRTAGRYSNEESPVFRKEEIDLKISFARPFNAEGAASRAYDLAETRANGEKQLFYNDMLPVTSRVLENGYRVGDFVSLESKIGAHTSTSWSLYNWNAMGVIPNYTRSVLIEGDLLLQIYKLDDKKIRLVLRLASGRGSSDEFKIFAAPFYLGWASSLLFVYDRQLGEFVGNYLDPTETQRNGGPIHLSGGGYISQEDEERRGVIPQILSWNKTRSEFNDGVLIDAILDFEYEEARNGYNQIAASFLAEWDQAPIETSIVFNRNIIDRELHNDLSNYKLDLDQLVNASSHANSGVQLVYQVGAIQTRINSHQFSLGRILGFDLYDTQGRESETTSNVLVDGRSYQLSTYSETDDVSGHFRRSPFNFWSDHKFYIRTNFIVERDPDNTSTLGGIVFDMAMANVDQRDVERIWHPYLLDLIPENLLAEVKWGDLESLSPYGYTREREQVENFNSVIRLEMNSNFITHLGELFETSQSIGRDDYIQAIMSRVSYGVQELQCGTNCEDLEQVSTFLYDLIFSENISAQEYHNKYERVVDRLSGQSEFRNRLILKSIIALLGEDARRFLNFTIIASENENDHMIYSYRGDNSNTVSMQIANLLEAGDLNSDADGFNIDLIRDEVPADRVEAPQRFLRNAITYVVNTQEAEALENNSIIEPYHIQVNVDLFENMDQTFPFVFNSETRRGTWEWSELSCSCNYMSNNFDEDIRYERAQVDGQEARVLARGMTAVDARHKMIEQCIDVSTQNFGQKPRAVALTQCTRPELSSPTTEEAAFVRSMYADERPMPWMNEPTRCAMGAGLMATGWRLRGGGVINPGSTNLSRYVLGLPVISLAGFVMGGREGLKQAALYEAGVIVWAYGDERWGATTNSGDRCIHWDVGADSRYPCGGDIWYAESVHNYLTGWLNGNYSDANGQDIGMNTNQSRLVNAASFATAYGGQRAFYHLQTDGNYNDGSLNPEMSWTRAEYVHGAILGAHQCMLQNYQHLDRRHEVNAE